MTKYDLTITITLCSPDACGRPCAVALWTKTMDAQPLLSPIGTTTADMLAEAVRQTLEDTSASNDLVLAIRKHKELSALEAELDALKERIAARKARP